jgi:hypothetical protein
MRFIHIRRGLAARFAMEHFQAKWNTWRLGKCDQTNKAFSSQVEQLATRKMRPNKQSIFKPSGTLGDSENATKLAGMVAPGREPCPRPSELSSGVFSSQVEHLALRKIRPD